jgi:adenylyltransferase/sulfurtransferase
MSRFTRQMALPAIGEAGQQVLADARVILIGLGGLGCPAAQYLAGAGVGELVLCDHDNVDESNLARQVLYRDSDLGQPKVECASRALTTLAPAITITAVAERIDQPRLESLLDKRTIVVDGSDNYATRLAVNRACLARQRPWVMGAAVRFEGQLLTLRPDQPNKPCYHCLYGEVANSLDDCHGAGVFTPLTGVIGTAMAVEALRLLLGLHTGDCELTLFDARYFQWRQVGLEVDPNCTDCQR